MPETESTPVDIERLRLLLKNSTPGVWKLWGMQVMADQDGTSNVGTAVPVADTHFRDDDGKPKTWDASLIAETHNALAALLAEVAASRETLAAAWDEGHRTPQRRGPDNCRCSAYNEGECGCGKYGTGPILTPNPYRSA